VRGDLQASSSATAVLSNVAAAKPATSSASLTATRFILLQDIALQYSTRSNSRSHSSSVNHSVSLGFLVALMYNYSCCCHCSTHSMSRSSVPLE